MVISNLNIKLLEDRLGFIAKSVGKLKTMALLPEERFTKEGVGTEISAGP
jgi:hypothetical protein